MKVSELITELKKYPEDMDILLVDLEDDSEAFGQHPISKASISKIPAENIHTGEDMEIVGITFSSKPLEM